MATKFLALLLAGWVSLLALVPLSPLGLVHAQEATPEPTPATETSPTPEPTPSPEATSIPEATPDPTPEPTPAPFDPYNHPPYSSPEYDVWKQEYEVWKAEQDRQEALQETREDEWSAHDNDQAWVDAHGGTEDYYTSGQWQADQDAAAAAQAAAAQNPGPLGSGNCSQTPLDTESSSLATPSDTVDGSATATDIDSNTVTNDNCADFYTDDLASATSGDNAQVDNDGSVSLLTGDSSADGTLINQGNTNVTQADDDAFQASASTDDSLAQGSEAENFNTGEDSTNFASATEVDTLTVTNDNQAYADNNLTVEGTSGSNLVADNDGSATLTTGDIELIANMLNILNLNITGDDFLHLIVNIFGQLNGTLDLDDIAAALGLQSDDQLEVIAQNTATGEDSDNTAEAVKEETTDITNTNSAEVNNTMDVSAVSGQNEVVNNDGTADVITGRIQILANLMNFINANFSGEKWSFIMVNIFGSLTGDIIVPDTQAYLADEGTVLAQNVGAGEDSHSSATATSEVTTSVTNTNSVDLTNTINADGISGENDQSGNDDDGTHTLATGAVDVATQLMNFLNFNITGNNWVFLIVNVFGTWMGQIVNFAGTGTLDAPEGSFAALSVGGSGSSSSPGPGLVGGDGSTNTASATYISDTTVSNTNSAQVNNTMNIEGVSGQNAVNHNDASTSLTTGWVEIDANLLNIINMNVTGRSWMIVFLNVFGDFVGNLFFGAPPPLPAVTAAVIPAIGGGPSTSSTPSSADTANTDASSPNPEPLTEVLTPVTVSHTFTSRSTLLAASSTTAGLSGSVLTFTAPAPLAPDGLPSQPQSFWASLTQAAQFISTFFSQLLLKLSSISVLAFERG